MRVAVVVSRYNRRITDALEAGARSEFERRGVGGRLEVVSVPGAFELAVGAGAAQRAGFDGVVCLGCLITGETTHDRYIAGAVSHALAELSAREGVPVGFGLLTCQTVEQAEARAGGAMGNKGAEAMGAVLETLAALRGIGPA